MMTPLPPRPTKPVTGYTADVVRGLAIGLSALVSTLLIHDLTRGITGYVEVGLVVVISVVCGSVAAQVPGSAGPGDGAHPSGHRQAL